MRIICNCARLWLFYWVDAALPAVANTGSDSPNSYCKFISALEEIVLESVGCQSEAKQIVEVSWADRWQVYQRLQELDIPCSCATEQPLMVHIANVTAAVQLWSVSRQLTQSRQDLLCWLEYCWQCRLEG